MKKKDGVALLSLVITIIVIIILAMISYSASSSTIKRATYTKYTSNMKQLQDALDVSAMKVRSQTIVKGKLLSNAQLYNYIAKGGTTELDFVEKGKEPSYTVITDNSSIDMDLPEFNVNTNDKTGVKIVYAVTGDGTVFAWPPYKYKDEYHLNDNDTVGADKVGATGNVDVIISGKDTVIKIDDDGVLVNPDENVSGETIKTELEKPTVSGVYTYNGYEQTVSLDGFDEEKMTIVNGSRKNAGTDVVVVGLKEPDKYKWKDETSNHITISWTIEKKEVSAVWTNLTFQYDGKSHIPMAKVQGMANEKINVSLSGAQVDGGTYTASVAISSVKGGSVDNYILSNSTVEYQILVSEIAVDASDYSGVYDGNEKTISLTVTNPVNGVDIYYSATTELNASNYSSAGSKTKPTVSTAGVTTIHYYITARNVPAKAGSNKVIIEKAPITSSVNMQDYRYGGTKQEPSVNGNIGNGNVTYYVNTVNTNDGGRNWAEITDSYALNAGKYYMYAVIDETLNYKGVKTEVKEFDIYKNQLMVGDYVNYIPESKTAITYTGKTGYNKTQLLTTQSDAKWRILSIDEGTGEVILTSQGVTNKDTNVYLDGVTGYLHGAEELNRICKELYSSDSLTARSMTIEDLNKAIGYNPTTNSYYGAKYTYTTGEFYTYEEDGQTITTETPKKASTSNPVTVKNTSYSYNLGGSNSTVENILGSDSGWLASASVSASNYNVLLDMRVVDSSSVSSYTLEITLPGGVMHPDVKGIRPVISLNANQINITEDGKDGTTIERAWNLK